MVEWCVEYDIDNGQGQMGSTEAWYSGTECWTPGRSDRAQVDECTRDKARYNAFTAGLSDEEICVRALREMEWLRVSAEVNRAALAMVVGELTDDGRPVEVTVADVVDQRLTDAITGLNLMGIETLLPGEAGPDTPPFGPDAACVHLRQPANGTRAEQLDALSGLIGEFHRSDIMINGLRIAESGSNGNEPQLTLVAAHAAVMTGFGEFLSRKYITEGFHLLG